MPTRGYRKGISDTKEPVPCSIRTHVTQREFDHLTSVADSRSVTLSKLLRALVTAFVDNGRVELPHGRGPSTAALRELCRIGNNLNQIAREAHLMRLPQLEREARATIATINAAARRLMA